MCLKIWQELVPVFALSKQQPSEPKVMRMHQAGPCHEKKVEKDGEACGSHGGQQVIRCPFW